MTFTDLSFLFFFLPVVWLLYRPVSRFSQAANVYLAAVSLMFYAWGSLQSLCILLFVLFWNYFSAAVIFAEKQEKRRKLELVLCVSVNLLLLITYRYLPVWLSGMDSLLHLDLRIPVLQVPVGLSFYILSALSCVIDVYSQRSVPLHSFVDFTVYAAFFGRINMGPIASYSQMKPQLKKHPVSRKLNRQGTVLFLQGLFMKVILADNLTVIFLALQKNTSWLGTILTGFSFFFLAYFYCAGYSRMARGIGAWFGFVIPANFNHPYLALSVQDFWKRWHISLTSWFVRYVYLPLGGRNPLRTRWMFNVLAVWLLIGLWHGPAWTFLIWGLYQGGLLLLEGFWLKKYLDREAGWLRHFYLILTQLIGWAWFFSPDPVSAVAVIGRYFFIGVSSLADNASLFYLKTGGLVFLCAAASCAGLPAVLSRIFRRWFGRACPLLNAVGYAFCFAVCIAFLVSASALTFTAAGW